jgi:hypothetical protein
MRKSVPGASLNQGGGAVGGAVIEGQEGGGCSLNQGGGAVVLKLFVNRTTSYPTTMTSQ